jgi:hypothetical protein
MLVAVSKTTHKVTNVQAMVASPGTSDYLPY